MSNKRNKIYIHIYKHEYIIENDFFENEHF